MKDFSKALEDISDKIVVLFVVALFLIDFLPHSHTEDIIYPQYLYLAGLNFIMATYIAIRARYINKDLLNTLKRSPIFWLFSIFVVLCGLSFVTAVNKTLVVEKLADLIIAFCLLINFTFLLWKRFHLIPKIILIVCIVAFLQSAIDLYHFKRNFDKISIDVALTELGVSTGNINILAASLTVKIPFILLGFSHYLKKIRVFLFITLIMVTAVVLLTAARAAIISTILVYILFVVYNIKINSFGKSAIVKTLPLVIPLLIAVTISSLILKEVTNNERYVSITSRLGQVNTKDASANARLVLWRNTFELAKTKPLTGVGLGNYKIESIPYEKTQNDESSVSQHTHNDFLEIASETGFLNSIVYVSFFIAIFIVNGKRFFKSKDIEIQSLAILTIMTTVVYGVDSFFNFPMFKATMMIFLCLIIIFTLINVNSRSGYSKQIKNKYYTLVAIVSVITVYFAFLGYKASNLEYQIKKDESKSFKNAILTGDNLIKSIPPFKNTLSRGEAFYEYAGIYYYYENKLDLALKYLSKADKINPYLGRVSLYKMRIALKKGNLDSAFVYSKNAFYMRPRNLNFYTLSIQMARGKKDTLEILKQHKTFTKYRNIPLAWKLAADELKNTKYSTKSLLNFINKGIMQFPGDATLLKTKNEIIANKNLDKAQLFLDHKNKTKALEYYLEALKNDPSNADIMQYLAFYYYNENKCNQALSYFLKALNIREFTGGRTEFFVGNCYLKLNDKANALKYLNLSKDKGYAPSKELITQLSIFNSDPKLLKKRENDLMISNLITQGQKYAEQKKFDEALKTYEKAMKIDPENIYVAQNIGFHYFKTGNPKKAKNYLLNALKYPGLTDGKTEYFLAVCYLQENDKENACKYWNISKNKNYSNSVELLEKFCK